VTRVPTGYLDTALVIAVAKRDLDTREQEALHELLRLKENRCISLVVSEIVDEELRQYGGDGVDQGLVYSLLEDVQRAVDRRGSSLTLMGVGGGPKEDPTLTRLKSLLRDEADARHLFQAISAGVDYFITTDKKSILLHAGELREQFGIEALLPSTLVGRL
jgi:hypothetical protein